MRQLGHSLPQVFDDDHVRTYFRQRVLNRTGFHKGDGLAFHITQAHKVCLPFATDDLIVKSEDGTRIIRQILSVRRIDHHRQIRTTVQHVGSDILPGVRPKLVGYSHATQHDFRKLYVKSVRQTFIIDIFQRSIVEIDGELERFLGSIVPFGGFHRQACHYQQRQREDMSE